jgi:hypothetical protein
MKYTLSALALSLVICAVPAQACSTCGCQDAKKETPAAAAKLNTVCPFSGEKVDGKITIDVKVGDKTHTIAVADKTKATAALKDAKAEDVVHAAEHNHKLGTPHTH